MIPRCSDRRRGNSQELLPRSRRESIEADWCQYGIRCHASRSGGLKIRINLNFLVWPFYMMLIVGLMMPSTAYHGLLSPKSLTFLLTIMGTATLALIRFRFHANFLKTLCFLLFALSFLIAWLAFGNFHDPTKLHARIDQFKLFIITLTVPLTALYLYYEKKITVPSFIKTVLYANLAYCTTKITLIFMHLLGIINIWKLLTGSGIAIQSMFIFGGLQRLQTSVDISTPFLVLFLLQSKQFSPRFKWFYIGITLISNFLTFSRFLLFVYVLCIALHLFTLNFRQMMKAVMAVFAIAIALTLAIGVENVGASIHKRFLSKENSLSDDARFKQVDALMGEFDQSPYFGQGLGGYVKNHIRDRNILHSYEVQWVAFLMQFGIFGILLLLIPLGIIASYFIRPPFTRQKIAFLTLFACWLFSGFTNPFLISLQSGIIYTLFLLTGISLKPTQKLTRAATGL